MLHILSTTHYSLLISAAIKVAFVPARAVHMHMQLSEIVWQFTNTHARTYAAAKPEVDKVGLANLRSLIWSVLRMNSHVCACVRFRSLNQLCRWLPPHHTNKYHTYSSRQRKQNAHTLWNNLCSGARESRDGSTVVDSVVYCVRLIKNGSTHLPHDHLQSKRNHSSRRTSAYSFHPHTQTHT